MNFATLCDFKDFDHFRDFQTALFRANRTFPKKAIHLLLSLSGLYKGAKVTETPANSIFRFADVLDLKRLK